MNEFKAGDVVRLDSGGPRMTVSQIGQRASTGEDSVWCVWFEGAKKCEDVFPPAALALDSEPALPSSYVRRPHR
jgi:uncharacterized protein YodC (DUF2158 family)